METALKRIVISDRLPKHGPWQPENWESYTHYTSNVSLSNVPLKHYLVATTTLRHNLFCTTMKPILVAGLLAAGVGLSEQDGKSGGSPQSSKLPRPGCP